MAKNEGGNKKKSYSKMKVANPSTDEIPYERQTRSSRGSIKKRTSQGNSWISQLPEIHCSCERIQNELYQFIDDFITSQEYQDYLNFKASIVKKDQEVQYDITDLNVIESEESIKSEEHFDLSRRALRVFILERQIEKYASNLKNAEILKKQQEAIKLIRQKIAEVKKVFQCHRKEREEQEKEKKQQIVQKFIKTHNIDVSRMLSTNRLDKVILEVERKLRMKRRTHKNNIKSIVEKLLKEYKEKRSSQKKIIKQRRFERVEKGGIFHLKGRVNSLKFISSVHMPRAREDKVLKEFREAGVCLKEEPISKIVPTNENTSEEFTPSSGASIEEGDFQDGPYELTNEDGKYKIYLDDSAHKKLGILQTFVEFENTLEARHFLCLCEKERKDKEKKEFDYPDDTAFIIKPNRLKFQNFGKGKIYKKQMVLINMSGYGVKIRLLKIYTEDPARAIYFELETDEMKVARPGLPIKYTLIFKPHDDMNITVGWLVFLICNKSKYYRRIIPIECIPTVFQVAIEPMHLTFGVIPIWKLQNKQKDISRMIKVKSSGSSNYKVIMKRMIDPFELISFSTEEEYDDFIYDAITEEVPKSQAVLDVEAILLDVIQEVESDFRIDKRFLQIDKFSAEQKIEVSLSSDKFPGFFIEKYQFDIYEVDGTNDVYKGMQEITLILEVSDYPIKCEPLCVDFGICFLDVAYQTKFYLTNITNITQPVSVKVPSTLSYYISTDEKAAYIRAEESREITMKFLPSRDFLTDKNKYYDPSTDILCFPFQVKLLNKQYADAPPLIQQGFAILCNCADLKVGPVFAHHYSLIDENMVLDLGECFVNEVVVTQIVLKNPCCTTIYYCFKNLPPYMTIMPNYGIGAIEACQQLDLKLFIHPTLDDFEGAGMDAHIFNEVKQFKISVATMDKVGKYRRKPDQNRLVNILKLMLQQLRKVEDNALLEEICFARCLWRVKMIPCSCESAIERAAANEEIQQEVFLSNLPDFENYGMQQPLVSPVTAATYATNVDDFSDSSSKSSRTGIKQEDNTKTTNQMGKKKKRKTPKRKTRESGNILTLSPFVDDSEGRPGTTEVLPLSPGNPLVIPTNSETNFAENLTSSLHVKTTFIKPLYELSFNHIEFPATPGASFSTMTTELRPLKFLDKSCICGFEPKPEKPKYRATFRIAGSTEEIRIEPTYGNLEYRESRLITVVATPKINDDVVAGYAFDRKRSALLKEKILKAEQNRTQKGKARKKSRSKSKTRKKTEKAKSPRSKKSTEEDQEEAESPPPTVLSEEIQVGILDFYPAEIAIWRNIEPYFLNVNFVCHVEYDFEEFWYHPPDVFSLETVCKVIPPDFIHDQKSQHLDFGQVAIGESRKKIITVQNIRYNDIVVRTSILRPHGSFTCPNFDPIQLPSESFLRIPITYTATKEEKELEYMDIKAERTIYQFVLLAEGIPPSIRIEPSLKVLRVLSKKGKTAEISFEIKNDSSFPVTVQLEKVCELEGVIISPPPVKTEKEMVVKKEKKSKKKREKSKSPKSSPTRKKEKEITHSEELTESEIYSMENSFEKNSGAPYFVIDKEEHGKITLVENSKSSFKILFGQPEQLLARQLKTKEKKKKKPKSPRGKHAAFPIELIGKTCIAKYNIILGSSTFLRDFIIVGEFRQK